MFVTNPEVPAVLSQDLPQWDVYHHHYNNMCYTELIARKNQYPPSLPPPLCQVVALVQFYSPDKLVQY